jgi:PPOX class probable F420-dependent enzyme
MARPIEVPATHAGLLSAPLTAVLTTLNADGSPQSTAVWFLVDAGVLITSTTVTRQKYRNLRRDPRTTLVIIDPADPARTLEIRATAELRLDPDLTLEPAFAQRYDFPLETLRADTDPRVIISLDPIKVITTG